MSFINLSPDTNPNGAPFIPRLGVRYFYFSFIPNFSSIQIFLSRNVYRYDEAITRIYTLQSPVSLLTISNISNVTLPCTFINGLIELSTPSGSSYENNSNVPNFILNNLIPGTTYILEFRLIYSEPPINFGVKIKSFNAIIPLKYVRTSSISLNITMPISEIPETPNGLVANSVLIGVSLNWNATVQASSYLIYRDGLLISSSTTPNFIDTHVISGNPYSYTVSALNLFGESTQSYTLKFIPIFSFTCISPDKIQTELPDSNVRFYYFLFTPITSSIDAYIYNNQSTNQKSIIGIYDTTNPKQNLLKMSNISQVDSNITFKSQKFGTYTVEGLYVIANGIYTNLGEIPNFRINLSANFTESTTILKTYILEIVSYKNTADDFTKDFGIYLRNVINSASSSASTQVVYNSVNTTRTIPVPYCVTYDFTSINNILYTNLIYPNLFVFQHVKNVLESIILSSPKSRPPMDMIVNININEFDEDTIAIYSLDKWTVDTSRSPDFPYQQALSLNSVFFSNGYMNSPAMFNGSSTVNNLPNIALFNILLHEIIHGLGFIYTYTYNNTTDDVGWNSFLTNVSINTPWYKGPDNSSALSSYRVYCKNPSLQRIPVESHYGTGVALNHWAEGSTPMLANDYRYFNGIYHPALKHEIMSGIIKKNDYLTGVTSGVLKDYGYNVSSISPYIVNYPFFNIVHMSANTETMKCACIQDENRIKHILKIQKSPTPLLVPRKVYYVRQLKPLFYK